MVEWPIMNISKYIGEIEAELQNMELNKMIAEIRSTNVDDSLKIIEVGGMFLSVSILANYFSFSCTSDFLF